MIMQKYIVMLSSDPANTGRQVFLGYDAGGRIGNASYQQAFRYDSEQAAKRALWVARKVRRWPDAKILGTCVDTKDSID